MSNVMVIPARRQVGNNIKKAEKPKLRVAAYCRVSTDSDEQATSYEAQIEHYTEFIQKNPEWVLAGIFADDGISGTNTKKREEFNRMIDECHAGNIDMIITKSISRFARNTLDCLKFIRELKDINIPVFFEKESINTMDAKGEVLLTIMAPLLSRKARVFRRMLSSVFSTATSKDRCRSTTTASSATPKMLMGTWSSIRRRQRSSRESTGSTSKAKAWTRSLLALRLTAFSQALARPSGTQAPSTRFSETKNTWGTRSCRRPTPRIS